MKPLRIPALSDYKLPPPKIEKPMSYEDTAECPCGHVFTLWRRIATAGRLVQTRCPECLKVFAHLAGAVPDNRRKPARESDIERHLVHRVKALGGEVRKVKWVGRSGAPDRLVMLPAFQKAVTAAEVQAYAEEKQEPMATAKKVLQGPVRKAQTIWIELKAPGGAATFPKNAHERAQHREHERMRKMGQRVEVVDSYERIEEILK